MTSQEKARKQLVAGWDQLDVAPGYWGMGDVLALSHALTIPEDMPAGEYQIISGWYSPETGVWLPTNLGGDHISLGEVRIGGAEN